MTNVSSTKLEVASAPKKTKPIVRDHKFAGFAFAFCRADLLFEVDKERRIMFAAGATQKLLGRTPDDLNGEPFPTLVATSDRTMVSELLDMAGTKGRINDVPTKIVAGSGIETNASLAGYRVPEFDNNLFLAVKLEPRGKVQLKITESDLDVEAGVLNQKTFGAVASDRIQSFKDAGGDPKMTMIHVENLDALKQEVSTESHGRVMNAIGDILKSHSLGGDTAGRIDDENFSFAHDGTVDAEAVGREISDAASEIEPDSIKLSTSSTTMDADDDGMSDDEMTKALVYTMQAFAANDGQLSPANMSEMLEQRMAETVSTIETFKRISKNLDFDLVFMPICDLKTGEVHHFEALTRFRDSAGESPYRMITMAEEVGVIQDFDLAVAKRSIGYLENFGTGAVPGVAINVSGHSINNDQYVQELHHVLSKYDGLNHVLTLEITESAEITELEKVNSSIQSFRDRGFKVALDDFGAGAAGFDYLNSFDIDTAKFDGPVVKRAYATDRGKAFLASMATLCHQTGVETIAEMVEDEALANFLAECGVQLGQGWYFGKPDGDPVGFIKKVKSA